MRILALLFAFLFIGEIHGQLEITGKVLDGTTKEELPFADIYLKNNIYVGTSTEMDGSFTLDGVNPGDTIVVTLLGYDEQEIRVDESTVSPLEILLGSESLVMDEISITAKKKKYEKDNPATRLLKKVVAARPQNDPRKQKHLSYHNYELKELFFKDVDPSAFAKGPLKSLQAVEQYIGDSDEEDDICFYIKEKVDEVTNRNGSQSIKTLKEKDSKTNLRFIDQNLPQVLDLLVQDFSVYDNSIFVLNRKFICPISPPGLNFYRHYIKDTIVTGPDTLIHLWFTTANKQDIGFAGDIYIDLGGKAVQRVEFEVDKRANINFTKDIKLVQEFVKEDGRWLDKTSSFQAVFKFLDKGNGILGRRTTANANYTSSADIDNKDKPKKKRGDEFWGSYRDLTDGDPQKQFETIESLNKDRRIKFFKKMLNLVVTGHWKTKYVELGSISSFYTFNNIEGDRFTLQGRTTTELFKNTRLSGYAAYGTEDKQWKYKGALLYSFNDRFDTYPFHHFDLIVGKENYALGRELEDIGQNNVLTSFVRGNLNNFILNEYYNLKYNLELDRDYRFIAQFKKEHITPKGELKFQSFADDGQLIDRDINLTSFGLRARWAPNEKYLITNTKRSSILSRNPIFEVIVQKGLDGFLEGQFDFTKLELLAFKRLYLSNLGYSDFLFEAGKLWGDGIPYNVLFVPRGNQSFFYQHRSLNLLDYFSFFSDEYFSINYRHFFNGFVFNRIPLLKKTNMRLMLTGKFMWGRLRPENDPSNIPKLIQIQGDFVNSDYLFDKFPYGEISIGFANIFKLFRVDLVRRVSYLHRNDVPNLFGKRGYAIMVRIDPRI